MASELRQKMIDHMTLRNYSPRTIDSYIRQVERFAKFYNRSPAEIAFDEVEGYLLYMVRDKHSAFNTVNQAAQAIKYVYQNLLGIPEAKLQLPNRRTEWRLPQVLTFEETLRLINTPESLKHRAILHTIYGGGLRVSEAARLKPEHIDSSRMLIRVEQGKGHKDRYTILPRKTLDILRRYHVWYNPGKWLFFGRDKNAPIPVGSIQTIYYMARDKAKLPKAKGVHMLRHCFATHHLEQGTNLLSLKRMMGHSSFKTLMVYLHLLPDHMSRVRSPLDC